MRLAHIRERRDFKAAAAKGRRFRNEAFTAQLLLRCVDDGQDNAQAGLRLGLTASRQTGTAVERNRIRRRLRAAAEDAAAARAGQAEAPIDLVIVARREALSASFTTLASQIRHLLEKSLRDTARQMAQQQAQQ